MNAGTVGQNQYVPLGAQFENVSGGAIAVKDAVKVGEPIGFANIGGADQIWIWDTPTSTWTKYFYFSSRGATRWVKDGDTTTETTDTIPVGKGIFFQRSAGASASEPLVVTFTNN